MSEGEPLVGVPADEIEAGPARSKFDPVEIAERAVENGEDPLVSVLGQYGGYLSTCWENLAGAGIFESTRAAEALKVTEAWVREHTDTPAAT